MDQWYVMRTKSKHEGIVENALKTKEIRFYLPRRKEAGARSKVPSKIPPPLFPGYVFVQLHRERIQMAQYIIGSCGLLMFCNKSADQRQSFLPAGEI